LQLTVDDFAWIFRAANRALYRSVDSVNIPSNTASRVGPKKPKAVKER